MENTDDHFPMTADDRRAAVEALGKLIRGDDGPLAIRAVRILVGLDEANVKHEAKKNRDMETKLRKILSSRESHQ